MNIQKFTRPMRYLLKRKYCGAVIVAAGTASRMGGIDKVMAPLDHEPMLIKSVRAFEKCPGIDEIVIVTRPDLLRTVMELCDEFEKVTAVVAGGSSRPESVKNGLSALSKKVKLAAIHDGARPLISWELIDRTVRAANTYGAAAPGIAVKDTTKIVKGGMVTFTPDRETLRAIQTPQVFDIDLLKAGLKKSEEEEAPITDDCSAVELLGFKVRVVGGEERNIKVTTPMDLKLAQMLWEDR